MTDDDGIALNATRHPDPRPRWWNTISWWLWRRWRPTRMREASLEELKIEISHPYAKNRKVIKLKPKS